MSTPKEPIDSAPLLDIGVAVDHEHRVYQIQLYGSNLKPEYDMTIAVLPPQRLEMVLYEIRDLVLSGYQPIGEGTSQPNVRLPCPAEKMLDKWK